MIIYIPFRILVFFLKLLPFFLYAEVSKIIGKIVFSTMGKTRKRIIKNIEIAFGNKYSIEERKNICQQVLSNIILNFLELDQLTKLKKEKLMKMAEIEGEEILKNLLRENKGIVAICAHLGNFPIAQTILNKKGYPINMIVRDTNNKYLARYVKNWRKKMSLPAISKWNLKKAIDEAQKWMEKKGILCFYIDQYHKKGIKCNLFGKPFSVPTGPSVFAKKYDTPVIGIFTFKTGVRKHKIIIEGPYPIKKTKNITEDIKENTAFFIKRIEYYVSQYPEQWFSWLHRMFR
jgi:KDO2-lipid IV(A) lauroyltransferase